MSDLAKQIAFVFFQTSLNADGGVRSAQIMLRHFSRVKPIIITQKDSEIAKEFSDLGYEVIVKPVNREPGQAVFKNGIISGIHDLIKIFTINIWILCFLRRRGIRVVHCNDVLSFLYFGFGAALSRAKIVFVLRRSFEQSRPYSRKYLWAFKLSKFIVTLSQEMKSELVARFGDCRDISKKITNIYSGVDREFYYVVDEDEKKALRTSLDFDASCFYISYVGAFTPRKGQLEFLREAFLPIMHANKQIRLNFIGDYFPENSSYSKECEEFVLNNNLNDKVKFLGGIRDIAEWYRVSDLVVLASSSEGLARAMIESLCIGVPVVSFDVSSAKEILTNYQCGEVVEKGDYQGLVDAITKIAGDGAFRQTLHKNALRVAAELFDANRCAHQFEDLYDL